ARCWRTRDRDSEEDWLTLWRYSRAAWHASITRYARAWRGDAWRMPPIPNPPLTRKDCSTPSRGDAEEIKKMVGDTTESCIKMISRRLGVCVEKFIDGLRTCRWRMDYTSWYAVITGRSPAISGQI